MNKEQLINLVSGSEYDFLRENEYLGPNVMFLTIGGSYAYGTNVETSDIDIRGVAAPNRMAILTNNKFEQVENKKTDSVIYEFNKYANLLKSNNANCIELLGCKPEHYIYVSPYGQQLIDNKKIFLCRNEVKKNIGGYANAQLRRLQNALAHDNYPEKEKEIHIINSMKNTMNTIFEEFGDSVLLYIGTDDKINIKFRKDYDAPIRQTTSMLSQLQNIVRDYDKLNHRNKKKDNLHLNKHAMHLARLYLMAIDILEKEEIITYRENDLDLLMKIRNGFFQNADGSYHPIFFEFVNDLESRFQYALENSSLPEKADEKRINEFIADMNYSIVLGKVFPINREVNNEDKTCIRYYP